MGGSALGYVSRRITTPELHELVAEIKASLPQMVLVLVKSYASKADHGDIDLVALGPIDQIVARVNEALAPESCYANGPYYSIDYKGVQVDFISAPTVPKLKAMVDYLAWNDLGNLVGRVARSLGFKYGHKGLLYVLRLSDHRTDELLVSDDTDKVFEFLGYDPAVWRAGFETRDDVFAFAASTPYFNVLYFSLEHQSHQDRVRNKKRKMYQGFLEYINEHGLPTLPKLTDAERYIHLRRAAEFFNTPIITAVQERRAGYEAHAALKDRFNGDLVREWTGLSGKELGAFMSSFKLVKPSPFDEYLASRTPDDIKQDVLDHRKLHEQEHVP